MCVCVDLYCYCFGSQWIFMPGAHPKCEVCNHDVRSPHKRHKCELNGEMRCKQCQRDNKHNHNIHTQQTQTEPFLTMAVFEYLIANTDWSTQYLQNIKLLAKDSTSVPIAVPYDFDHAGIVNTPYALPTEELQLRSIRERRYRGYCVKDIKQFEPVLAKFNQLKKEIYSLYTSCTLLDAKYIKNTTQFLDEFYTVINNPKLWQKEFAYPCNKNGTGNVIIKGLKTD